MKKMVDCGMLAVLTWYIFLLLRWAATDVLPRALGW